MGRNSVTAAAAVIAITLLTTCNGNGNAGTPMNETNEAGGQQRAVSGQIAYVNVDSLMSNYELYIELGSELEEKAKKIENDLTSRGRSIERSYADLQEKAEKGLATRSQLTQMQEDLQKKEQNFYQYREQKQMELAEETQVMQNRIFHNLETFLADFNSDYRYSMILSTAGGSPVMYADPALNITDLVIEGMNAAYAKEKSAK